jgi:hypothetical protein
VRVERQQLLRRQRRGIHCSGSDHGGVVTTPLERRSHDVNRKVGESGAKVRVRGDATHQAQRRPTGRLQTEACAIEEVLDDGRLVRGGQIGG